MKTIEFRQPKNGLRLFKPELKFMDIWFVTNDYIQTTKLNEETKKEVMIRIHNFSIQLRDTFELYPSKNKKVYKQIELGLKESVRRAKISVALNKAHNKTFVFYWRYLATVLKQDAILLKDEHLQNAVQVFEKCVRAIEIN